MDLLALTLANAHINQTLTKVATEIGFPDSRLFSGKCFRVGCSDAMEVSDSTAWRIVRVDRRNAAGFASHCAIREDGGASIDSTTCAFDAPDSVEEEGLSFISYFQSVSAIRKSAVYTTR